MSTGLKFLLAYVVTILLIIILVPTGIYLLDNRPTFSMQSLDVKADKSAIVCAICAIMGVLITLRMMFILRRLEKK